MSQIHMTESQSNSEQVESGNIGRRLVDQLKNAFILVLILLWVSTLTVTVHRSSWITWLIASVILFLLLIFSYRKKTFRRPILRWILPFLGVGLLWIMYFLSGISFSKIWFIVLAIVMLLWTIPLLLSLIAVMMRRGKPKNRLDTDIERFVSWGEMASWFTTLVTLVFGIILGWVRVWNSGIKDWWMEPLLFWGVLIFVVVIIFQIVGLDRRRI